MSQIKLSGLNFPNDIELFVSDMRRVARANEEIEVPENVGNIIFVTSKDNFIAGPQDTNPDTLRNYGPRAAKKLIILDERMPEGDKRPHSMDWITPTDLIAAVEMKVPEGDPAYQEIRNGSFSNIKN